MGRITLRQHTRTITLKLRFVTLKFETIIKIMSEGFNFSQKNSKKSAYNDNFVPNRFLS